jgi:hypothetical protein
LNGLQQHVCNCLSKQTVFYIMRASKKSLLVRQFFFIFSLSAI